MTIPRNPYVAGNPVGNSPAFIGRAAVLREVLRVLRRPQDNAIVLYGQRRIGKTSILQHLASRLPEEGPYRPVYFDLQDKAAWSLGDLLQDMARVIAHALGQPDPDLGPDPETAFRDEWLPGTLDSLPEGTAVVLLLDEFDVLSDPKAEHAAAAFFPYLRGLLSCDPVRLQFEFVIGRNVDDLSNIALSVFKGTPARHISLLSQEDSAELVRLSEANNTLHWPEEAIERVWEWARGHPFLTQQLCSHVWERAYDEASPYGETGEPPAVAAEEVDAAVPEALDASKNTLEWLWDGLPPAARVVASALAEAGTAAISPEALERLLYDSGVRVVIRELQSAPQLLQEWDLIEPDDAGYRFRVEMLRRWIAEKKPLRRVQEELDHIEPVAENLYQAAQGLYQAGQLEQAVGLLRQAVALNPNHVRANQLLADILLAQGKAGEAVKLLERLSEYQPAAARPRLIQALLTLAQEALSDEEQLDFYERVLTFDPTQPEALAGQRNVWKRRGDAALEAGDLEFALEAYQTAGVTDRIGKVAAEMNRRALAAEMQAVEKAEQEGAYEQALDLVRRLADRYPEDRDWASDLERLERKTKLRELYQRALGALHSGDRRTAQSLLGQVVALEPGYEEASRYLYLAVTGMDPGEPQGSAVPAEDRSRRPGTRISRVWANPISRRRLAIGGLVVVIVVAVAVVLDVLYLRSTGWVRGVAFSPNGAILASEFSPRMGNDKVMLWNVRTGEHLRTLEGYTPIFSPNGTTLGLGRSGSYYLWDAETGQELHMPYGYDPVFSPDGTTLAAKGYGGEILLCDAGTGELLLTLEGHTSSVGSLAFSPDGMTLASGSADELVILWDVKTGKMLEVLKGHTQAVYRVAFSPDGMTLASGSEDEMVILWDVKTSRKLWAQDSGAEVRRALAFSPDGATLAVEGYPDVHLWDAETGKELYTLEGNTPIFNPDGTTLAVEYYGQIHLKDVETGEQVSRFPGYHAAFSPDGTTLAGTVGDQDVILWDVKTGEQLHALKPSVFWP